MGDRQRFKPEKLFLRNLLLKLVPRTFFPETQFVLDTDYPEESRVAWLCFRFVRLHIPTTRVLTISSLTFLNDSLSVEFRLIRIIPRQIEIVFKLAACRKPLEECFRENLIKISYFLSSLLPIGSQTTNRVLRPMDIEFELAVLRNSSTSVFSEIPPRLASFLIIMTTLARTVPECIENKQSDKQTFFSMY